MQVTGQTKDGKTYRFVNGKWEPPVVVPSSVHERALRRVNKLREDGITHEKTITNNTRPCNCCSSHKGDKKEQ